MIAMPRMTMRLLPPAKLTDSTPWTATADMVDSPGSPRDGPCGTSGTVDRDAGLRQVARAEHRPPDVRARPCPPGVPPPGRGDRSRPQKQERFDVRQSLDHDE